MPSSCESPALENWIDWPSRLTLDKPKERRLTSLVDAGRRGQLFTFGKSTPTDIDLIAWSRFYRLPLSSCMQRNIWWTKNPTTQSSIQTASSVEKCLKADLIRVPEDWEYAWDNGRIDWSPFAFESRDKRIAKLSKINRHRTVSRISTDSTPKSHILFMPMHFNSSLPQSSAVLTKSAGYVSPRILSP